MRRRRHGGAAAGRQRSSAWTQLKTYLNRLICSTFVLGMIMLILVLTFAIVLSSSVEDESRVITTPVFPNWEYMWNASHGEGAL